MSVLPLGCKFKNTKIQKQGGTVIDGLFSSGFLLTGWAIFKNTNMQKQGGTVIDGLFSTGFLFTGWAISKNTNKKKGGTVIGGQNIQ